MPPARDPSRDYGIAPPFLFFYFVIKEEFIKTIPKILRYSHLPVNPYFIPFLLKKIFLDRLGTYGITPLDFQNSRYL
jgi:hypothetical protein